MPNIIRNSATAAQRRIPIAVQTETGAPWDGVVTGIKAQLSLAGATAAASTNDIVKVAAGEVYIELTQAESNSTATYVSARLPATGTQRLAMSVADIMSQGEWNVRGETGAAPHLGILARGTAQAATATTLQLAAGETHGDDTLIGATALAFGTTQGYWQARQITDYVLSTDTATVDTWTVTPSGSPIFYVVLGSAPSSASAPPQVALIDGAITAPKIGADAITAAKVAADVHTEAAGVTETAIFAHSFGAKWNSWTFKQLIKVLSAAAFGKGVGHGTTSVAYRNALDDGTVISATGADADGNRGTITVTPDA